MVKYATALRLGTAESETILRRFTRGGPSTAPRPLSASLTQPRAGPGRTCPSTVAHRVSWASGYPRLGRTAASPHRELCPRTPPPAWTSGSVQAGTSTRAGSRTASTVGGATRCRTRRRNTCISTGPSGHWRNERSHALVVGCGTCRQLLRSHRPRRQVDQVIVNGQDVRGWGRDLRHHRHRPVLSHRLHEQPNLDQQEHQRVEQAAVRGGRPAWRYARARADQVIQRRARIGVLAGAVLLLGACSSGGPGSGTSAGPEPDPMRFGDGWVNTCAPVGRYSHMVFDQFLSVPGHDAVSTSVETVDAVDLEVRRYLILVDPPEGSVGHVQYPPKSPSSRDALPAEGATIPADEPIFLIGDVKTTTSSGGKLSGSCIHYSIAGKDYVATTQNKLEIGQCKD